MERKSGIGWKFAFIGVACLMMAIGIAVADTGDRINPKGKVTLFDGSQKVGEYTSESPLPEGKFISCDDRCGVKMKDLFLVALSDSLFSVQSQDYNRDLGKKGNALLIHCRAPEDPEHFDAHGNRHGTAGNCECRHEG